MSLPFDAWTFARLLPGLPVNGELQAVSRPFRDIARRLADLPSWEARQAAWEAFLNGRDDRDEIIMAVAAAKPEGPPPDPSEYEEWGPIRLGTLPPAEPFPLDVLALPARRLAEAAARSIGCPVDFPAAATLAAASGIIGRSASIRIKEGYFQTASLYLALVGDSSDGKTPSLDAAMEPIRDIASRLHDEHQEAVAVWGKAPEAERGDRPKSRRIDTSNPTVEALTPFLAHNPRGAIVLPDEFTGWCLSMGQYKGGKGADKQFYLSAWSGSRVVIDRAKDAGNPTIIPRPYLTVAGGMTPGRLGTLASDGGDEDGFMSRLLFAYPEPLKGKRYSDQGIPQWLADDWRALIEALWRRPMRDLDGKPAPHVVKMTPEAQALWAIRCQAHLDEQDADDFPRSLRGPWGKLEAYAARLALNLHLMDLAADPIRPSDHEPPELPPRVIDDAWRLVAYFKSHARRIYATIQGRRDEGNGDVHALLGWITRNDRAEFSIRDIGKNFDRFKQDEAALTDALAWMTDRNLVRRPEPKDAKPKVGRKPSPRYEANPALWESPRFRQFRQNAPVAKSFDGNDGNAVLSEGTE